MAFLEVNNLHKSFGKTEVLKGVSFGMEKGEVVTVIGSSGNGKTTLLRCLNFLETADVGTVTLAGEEIFRGGVRVGARRMRETRLHFGLVFQSFHLFAQYSAFDNVKLPLALMEKERKKRGLPTLLSGDIDSTVHTLLQKFGLEDKKALYPCELSGGQCQRVAIARAMALKPDILCFDEPTSALDPALTGDVLNIIRELKEDAGITMIVVTHEMAFARGVSDKVLFMSEGRIVEAGTPSEIFDHPKNARTKQFVSGYCVPDRG